MTKILIKENLLSNVVIKSVSSSLTYTGYATNIVSTWAIPYGFSERYNLINYINEVSSIKDELRKTENFLTKSVKKYTNAQDDMDNSAKLLPANRINLRVPINRG